jgi:hypothetical protein
MISVRWAGYVARLGEKIIVHIILDGMSKHNKPLEKIKHTGQNDIKLDI